MHQTLKDRLLLLKQTTEEHSHVSIRKILEIFSGKGRLLILMILALPFCLPIPLPGMSVPFGLLIAFIGIRMAFGKHIWLPKRILSKQIKTSHLKKIVDKTMKLVKKMQVWTHPRLQLLNIHPITIINGVSIFILGLLLAIPIPIPFSNITAAWAIFILSFGIMEDDGLFILIGYLMFLITIIVYIIIGTSINAII